MAIPTTAVIFSGSIPAPPPGDQDAMPLSDGGSPAQIVAFVPRQATTSLRGTVKPDGTSITIDDDGTIHSVGTTGGGGTGGGTSASGGLYVCVEPAQDPTDGTRTQWILPAPQLAGTIGWLNRNDAMQRQLGPKAYFSVQGTQLTLTSPLEADGYLEFYYIQGTPSSESGGGGSVTPTGQPLLRGSSATAYPGNTDMTTSLPAGTQVGDLAIIHTAVGSGGGLPAPSSSTGWTTLTTSTGGIPLTATYSKILDSTDIAAGSVTVHQPGIFNTGAGFVVVVVFQGAYGGVRETAENVTGGTVSTTSAVQDTDVAIVFANGDTAIALTIAPSTSALQSETNAGSGFGGTSVVAVANAALTNAAVNTFTVSSGSSDATVVVVKVS